MKGSASPITTRQVLAGIADAIRPVECARTAAAVDRVLETATPGLNGETWEGNNVAYRVAVGDLDIDLSPLRFHDLADTDMEVVDATPGMALAGLAEYVLDGPYSTASPSTALVWQQHRYAPWRVSPHLFPGGETS